MYSQNKEDEIVLNYFGDFVGVLLDIGANDGITLSNSRLLIERGWEADLVEPSPNAFAKLRAATLEERTLVGDTFQTTYGETDRIGLYNFAIAKENGVIPFYESDWHLSNTDTSLLSTTDVGEAQRWAKHKRPDGTRQTFTEIKVRAHTWADSSLSRQKYSYITIDAEGMDWEIFRQMDLTHVRCVCIEWNSNNSAGQLMGDYAGRYGMHIIHSNAENIIFAR